MRILRALPRALIVLVLSSCVFSQPPEKDFSLKIIIPNQRVQTGSPITGELVLTNAVNHDVEVYAARGLDAYQSRFSVTVKDSQGNTPVFQPSPFFSSMGFHTLKVGETFTLSLNVSNLYQITKPGVYTVKVSRQHGEQVNTTIESNTVSITVSK